MRRAEFSANLLAAMSCATIGVQAASRTDAHDELRLLERRSGGRLGVYAWASGTRNDVAVAWPLQGGPVTIAAYLTRATLAEASRDAVLAQVGSIVARAVS